MVKNLLIIKIQSISQNYDKVEPIIKKVHELIMLKMDLSLQVLINGKKAFYLLICDPFSLLLQVMLNIYESSVKDKTRELIPAIKEYIKIKSELIKNQFHQQAH